MISRLEDADYEGHSLSIQSTTISIAPSSATLALNESQEFSYTAPSTGNTGDTITITATSDSGQTATATVTLKA